MPQFDFANVFWPQLFWLTALFAVLYFGIIRTTLPRLSKVMDEREDRITADLASAREAKEMSDRVAEEYQAEINRSREEARGKLAAAKLEAAKASKKRLAAADKRLSAKVAEAEQQISAARNAANAALRDIAAEGAEAIVARLTGDAPGRKAALARVDAILGGVN
ncbi:MAG: hypothetical protein APF82_05795 [Sphingomonadales bacterium BRH_c42]|nr:MAG: hypothetical protein APF82_05795 [Sphingomonadales bacterium BRH_c42]